MPTIELRPTLLPGCYELRPRVFDDARGRFVKVFNEQIFREYGLATHYAEEYYSLSQDGVLRGLHFQTPPHEHEKLVYCTQGAVMDVALDLRLGSPTYGEHISVRLDAEQGNALYIPRGMAHGFYVLAGPAVMVYKVTSVYAPEHDTGVRWDSAGIRWPDAVPITSERDRGFGGLEEFESPFAFRDSGGDA